MNTIRRLLMRGNAQKTSGGSTRLGICILLTMILLCVVGTLLLPLDAFISEKELKDIAPSLPYQIPTMNTEDIVDIQSQITCSIALLRDGTLKQWGQCDSIPKEVAQNDIVQIAAGYEHVLALDKEGNIYGWGDNSHNEIQGLSSYKNIEEIYALDGISAFITKEREIVLLGNTALYATIPIALQGHVKKFAFGIHHMAIVSDENEVFILGNQGSEFAQIPMIEVPIKDIKINHEQVLVLTEEGNIYTWGNDVSIPLPTIPTKIDAIAMSAHASYALSLGKVYGWGENNHKELEIPQGSYTNMYMNTYHMYAIQDNDIKQWGQTNYILGSDEAGRDMLTRIVHGGLITMGIGLIACIIEAIIALVIGIVAGLYGGWVDHILMRISEIIASIPFLPLVITLAAFLGEEVGNEKRMIMIMVLLGCLSWPNLARIIRAQVILEREKDYVWSARILGASTFHILRKQILPQIMGIFMVNITLSYADNMLIEATLSYLGFGVQAPYPSWGNMIEKAQSTYVMENCWWQWIVPAVCIIITIWSVNLIGEGLRRKYNPLEES